MNSTDNTANIFSIAREKRDATENTLRPTRLSEFIGQEAIKENLKTFIVAANQRNDALDHVLLSGPPGLGKTTLALIVADELNSVCKISSAPAIEKPKDIAGILSSNKPRSIVFIDEIHRLKSSIEEMLYTAMEDFRLDWVLGQGPAARTVQIPLPIFTLVGATTRPGGISAPLASRFGIHLRIDHYTEGDLAKIVLRSSALLDTPITEEAALLIAQCARGTPRIANRLLRRVRDYAQVLQHAKIDTKITKHSLQKLGIDNNGLDRLDVHILKTIAEKFNGGPVGIQTIAIAVDESMDTLEAYYEPFLIRKGYLQRTARGRMITDYACQQLHINLSKNRQLFSER